ncbi:MAG: MBL fold metallo-hydrolase [Hydrogenibacillus schlegelii]|uniref:MBL fold metallo-hydrolase n=1 Tax=Hydrogenibacillus schlegelii TaxID=1484 RepID=A0A947CVJ6_HYDSH|nr:MBL fold metallo-hydrolase [Hydrogenibacillus schlegelii]
MNAFLVGTERESLLIDAGFDDPHSALAIQKAVEKNNLAYPTRVLLTHAHPDHAGGVRWLRPWNAIVMFHREEEDLLRRTIGESLRRSLNGQYLDDQADATVDGHSVIALHTPGHTRGHLSFWLPEQRVLFSGDNVLGKSTTWIGPPEGNLRDYLRTLDRLDRLPVRAIAPGHGSWIPNPHERIHRLRRHRLEREMQILTFFQTASRQPVDLFTLTRAIYGQKLPDRVFPFAMKTMEAHLQKLIEDGLIRRTDHNQYSIKC